LVLSTFSGQVQVDLSEALKPGEQDDVEGLWERSLQGDCFTFADVDALHGLAKKLDPHIRKETTVWFVHDECDVTGGYDESTTTDRGFLLLQLRMSLDNLAICIAKVAKLRAAESLAAGLLR
jgi:hypothetical protein